LAVKRKFASHSSSKRLNLRKQLMASISRNASCQAYNKLQIVRHFGYGTYKFSTEPHLSICKICKKQVEPTTCTSEKTITEKSTSWERAEIDEYVTFGNANISEDIGVRWLKLKITTMCLWPPPTSF
ncbi:16979_t:CDS:2, partial [Funneliformis geosporum]